MEKIVDLANTYSTDELDAAMERGIAFRAFGYGQLKRTLERQRKNPLSLPGMPKETSNTLASYAKIQSVGVEQRELSYYEGYGS